MRYEALVSEVMNKNLKTISSGSSIKEAAKIMRENKIGSVIVTGEKHPKGIVTTSDIVYKYVSDEKGEKVDDIMTKELVTISPNSTIEEAAKLMTERGIEKLPVKKMNKIIGIITSNDILSLEPKLFEILLERMKIGFQGDRVLDESSFGPCDICGNYTDDLIEKDGKNICRECQELEE